MNIGTRIKEIRRIRRMTQKELGIKLGFKENSADIRVAQYESGSRIPKPDMIDKIAEVLDVSSFALTVPSFNSMEDIFHLLFALEDQCGLQANIMGNRLCLTLENIEQPSHNAELVSFLYSWREKALALKEKKISKQDYDLWRYNYSFLDK